MQHIALAGWAASLWIGVLGLAVYENRPGPDREPPARLPVGFSAPAGTATAWMAMHPECPCTEASLHELADIARVAGDRLHCTVLALVPDERPEWAHSTYAETVRATRGVELVVDRNGELARRLRSGTSGRLVLYDADGNLRFHGGITPTRAHRGESHGKDAVFSILGLPDATSGTADDVVSTAAFGCDLFGSADGGEDDCPAGPDPTDPIRSGTSPHGESTSATPTKK